jgi:hypothetical protein
MCTICWVVSGFRDGLGDTATWNNSRLRLDVFSAAFVFPNSRNEEDLHVAMLLFETKL